MTFQTTDLCDAFESELQVLAPILRSYGGARCAGGPIRTLKIFEDNALVGKRWQPRAKGQCS